jgi:hypothetical protein
MLGARSALVVEVWQEEMIIYFLVAVLGLFCLGCYYFGSY